MLKNHEFCPKSKSHMDKFFIKLVFERNWNMEASISYIFRENKLWHNSTSHWLEKFLNLHNTPHPYLRKNKIIKSMLKIHYRRRQTHLTSIDIIYSQFYAFSYMYYLLLLLILLIYGRVHKYAVCFWPKVDIWTFSKEEIIILDWQVARILNFTNLKMTIWILKLLRFRVPSTFYHKSITAQTENTKS